MYFSAVLYRCFGIFYEDIARLSVKVAASVTAIVVHFGDNITADTPPMKEGAKSDYYISPWHDGKQPSFIFNEKPAEKVVAHSDDLVVEGN